MGVAHVAAKRQRGPAQDARDAEAEGHLDGRVVQDRDEGVAGLDGALQVRRLRQWVEVGLVARLLQDRAKTREHGALVGRRVAAKNQESGHGGRGTARVGIKGFPGRRAEGFVAGPAPRNGGSRRR
jgi:hypothetical protein